MTRRELLRNAGIIGSSLLLGRRTLALAVDVRPATFVYKTVGDLAIQADVYRAADNVTRPALVWIHGGALIGGSRADISSPVKQHALKAGYVLVSLDYRLAPETQLPEIVQDIKDAFAWIRREGPQQFRIDPERIAVAGGSAGGYLTLATGFCVEPRPTVLLSLWGYGDLIGDWYSTPSPHPRHHRSKLTRDEAFRQVSGPPVADARDRPGDGGAFYQFCRQTGSWPQAVSGWDPHAEAERFYPFMPVKNVTGDYPPTALIHGTNDTDVPHAQSAMMAEQFEQHDVPHLFISVPNGEHGLGGAEASAIDEAYTRAFAFVDGRLQRA